MAEVSEHEISLEDIAAVLFDEVDRSSPMSAKAFHKITYFVNKRLEERQQRTDVEYFWYKFGTMTVTRGSSVAINRTGSNRSEVICATTPSDLEIPDETEYAVRQVAQEALDEHSDIGTEGLTDKMYIDAPYEFQRQYRNLDQCIQEQIESLERSETHFDRDTIRDHIHSFIDVFPEDDLREYQNELYLWYDLLSTQLDKSGTTLGDIEDIAELFWTIVMLDVATRPETGVDSAIFGAELNLDDPSGLQEYLKNELRQLEGEYLSPEDQPEYVIEAADAVMASRLDFVSP